MGSNCPQFEGSGGVDSALKTAVDGLKSSPGCLAAILFAAMFVYLMHSANQSEAARRAHTVDTLMERCMPAGRQGGP